MAIDSRWRNLRRTIFPFPDRLKVCQHGGGRNLRALIVTNIRFAFPEKRSFWSSFEDFLLPLSELPLELVALTSNSHRLKLQSDKARVLDLGRPLPGILDDMNLGYFPSLAVAWLKQERSKASLVHHYYLSTRGMNSFDFLASLNLLGEKPLIVGPAEVSHTLGLDDYRIYSRRKEARSLEFKLMQSASALSRTLTNAAFLNTLERCDKLVVASRYAGEVFSRLVSSKKLVLIPPPVRTERFVRKGVVDRNTLLTVGNLIQRKRIDVIIRALKEVRRQFPEARLQVIGEGPSLLALGRLARELGLESAVEFCGRVNETEYLQRLSSCGVFCHASSSEAYSHVLLEALAAGKPIVCTDITGSTDLVEGGKNGFLCPVGDSHAFAEAVGRILGDQELALKMGMASRAASVRHDWKNVARQYFKTYEKVTA